MPPGTEQNPSFKDSWHGNDTLWRIRELCVDDILRVLARLPPANESKHELIRADYLDPAKKATYHMTFIRKRGEVHPDFRWFIHQVEYHPD